MRLSQSANELRADPVKKRARAAWALGRHAHNAGDVPTLFILRVLLGSCPLTGSRRVDIREPLPEIAAGVVLVPVGSGILAGNCLRTCNNTVLAERFSASPTDVDVHRTCLKPGFVAASKSFLDPSPDNLPPE